MQSISFYFLVAFALSPICVLSQTPPDFTPSTTAKLEVIFGNTPITPGQRFAKAAVQSKPAIGTSDVTLTGSHILVVLDPDVPGSFLGGPAGSRTTVLHGLLTDYVPSATAGPSNTHVLTSSATGPSSWAGPAPPAENPPMVHRYIELLYAQPQGFKVPASQSNAVNSRVGFNITTFARDAGLGDLLRANWFEVIST